MLQQYQNIYFLGIGGVGVSALAAWFHQKKYYVSGYDRNESQFTLQLKSKGIEVQHNLSTSAIPREFLDNKNTLLVYTPAIKKDHQLFKFFITKKIKTMKRAAVLKEISFNYNVIAIAGTHGKTTVSVMLAHILKESGYEPNAFFGGLSKNYNANFLIGSSNYMIIEADEYDRSFLQLNPAISLITSIDKDHVDTYVSEGDMIRAYYKFYINTRDQKSLKFIHKTKRKACEKSNVCMPFEVSNKIKKFLNKRNNDFCFSLINMEKEIENFSNSMLQSMSFHNIQNAAMASHVAFKIGLNRSQIKKAFSTFKGVKRRFEYHLNTKDLVLIDDYAHHPKELQVLIKSVRLLHPKRKIFLIFQPHLFSRTQHLENEFVETLSLVDSLALLKIYPARELPIPNVSSENLLKQIYLSDKWIVDESNLRSVILNNKPNLIVVAGAGNVYKLIPNIKSALR